MAHINPALAVVGGDEGVWGDKNNAALAVTIEQTNDLDDRATVLETTALTSNGRLSALEASTVVKPTGGTDGQALLKSGTNVVWGTVSGGGGGGFTVADNGDGTFTMSGTGVADNGNGTYTVTY